VNDREGHAGSSEIALVDGTCFLATFCLAHFMDIYHLYSVCVSYTCQCLSNTLETRRLRGDLIEVFQIFKGIDDVKPSDFFTMSSTGLRGHKFKLYILQAHLDIRKNFLPSRVIDEWNRLPEPLLHCGTLSTFKERLDCYLKNRGYD